jgi:hypothetical protein
MKGSLMGEIILMAVFAFCTLALAREKIFWIWSSRVSSIDLEPNLSLRDFCYSVLIWSERFLALSYEVNFSAAFYC